MAVSKSTSCYKAIMVIYQEVILYYDNAYMYYARPNLLGFEYSVYFLNHILPPYLDIYYIYILR